MRRETKQNEGNEVKIRMEQSVNNVNEQCKWSMNGTGEYRIEERKKD
jgi:hypothetical protein